MVIDIAQNLPSKFLLVHRTCHKHLWNVSTKTLSKKTNETLGLKPKNDN